MNQVCLCLLAGYLFVSVCICLMLGICICIYICLTQGIFICFCICLYLPYACICIGLYLPYAGYLYLFVFALSRVFVFVFICICLIRGICICVCICLYLRYAGFLHLCLYLPSAVYFHLISRLWPSPLCGTSSPWNCHIDNVTLTSLAIAMEVIINKGNNNRQFKWKMEMTSKCLHLWDDCLAPILLPHQRK